jgi:hypothetical protein
MQRTEAPRIGVTALASGDALGLAFADFARGGMASNIGRLPPS